MIECTEGLQCLWCVRKLDEPAETAPLLLRFLLWFVQCSTPIRSCVYRTSVFHQSCYCSYCSLFSLFSNKWLSWTILLKILSTCRRGSKLILFTKSFWHMCWTITPMVKRVLWIWHLGDINKVLFDLKCICNMQLGVK
jgi:hypothetical protein